MKVPPEEVARKILDECRQEKARTGHLLATKFQRIFDDAVKAAGIKDDRDGLDKRIKVARIVHGVTREERERTA